MKLKFCLNLLVAVFICALPLCAQEAEPVIAKLDTLIAGCGFKYQNPALNIWSIPVETKYRVWKIVVSGSEKENIAIFLSKVADLPDKIPPDLLKTLLELNYDYDKGKFVLSEGTLYFRIDVTLRLLDNEELKSDINQCALAADEVYPKIIPFLEEANLPQSVPR